MALLKQFSKTATGETYQAAYHRVLAVNFNYVAMAVEIGVGIYRDERARRSGLQPVQAGSCAASGDEFTELFSDKALRESNPREAAYTLLKRQPMYAGAEDV